MRRLREGMKQSEPAASPATASVAEQLQTLQADRAQLEAQLGTAEPAGILGRIQGLEGQIEAIKSNLSALGQQLGTGDIVEFLAQSESSIKSLTEQLQAFQPEGAGSAEANSKGAAVQRIVGQIHALYEGGAAQTDETSALASIVGKLHAQVAERGGVTGTVIDPAYVQSLVDQVHALYAEREKLTYAFGSADAQDIAAVVFASERRRLVDQLHALYAERDERSRASGGERPPAATPPASIPSGPIDPSAPIAPNAPIAQTSSAVASPAPTPELATRAPDAGVQNDNGDLRPGMFGGGAVIVDDQPKAPVVPAVQIKRWAFVLDGDKVERREVISTVDQGNWLENAMGLSAGEEAANTVEPKAASSRK
jgi:hypothetical protein